MNKLQISSRRMDVDGQTDLHNFIDDVVTASKLPAKRRGAPIRPTVDKIASAAYEHGLLPEPLGELVGLVIRPNHIDQASLGTLVRNLYPASSVPSDVVLQVVGCLGIGELKPSLPIQAALLRWLVMIYHVIDEPSILSRAYPVLFNLLDVAAIRPQICHILALVTRRKHVQPFRIQAVLELSRQTGKDPALVGLLRVYKDYYPEIIVGDAVRGRASAFKHPDLEWRLRLDDIQAAHSSKSDKDAAFSRQGGFQVRYKSVGRPKNSTLPPVRTAHATEQSVTLEEINNATMFVKNLENIMLPSQLVAVLADPLLQKFLLLRPDEEAYTRINNWLSAALQDIRTGDADSKTIADVLGVLYEYVTLSKNLPPLVLNFFVSFLGAWNGRDGRDSVLGILSYTPLLEFEKLNENIFQPLETCILDNSPESQLSLLKFYRELLQNWHRELLTFEVIPKHAPTTLTAIVDHTHQLALTLTQTSPTLRAEFAIIEFLERYSFTLSHERLRRYIPIRNPPGTLIYTLFFSQSLTVVSRLCNILSAYKRNFQAAMAVGKPKTQSPGAEVITSSTYPLDYINRFNGFLMDICNCVWRMRAFTDTDPNALGCLVPRSRVRLFEHYLESLPGSDGPLGLYFGISHSPVLSLQSILALRELEDEALESNPRALTMRHPGPVTQASLVRLREDGGLVISWQDYRLAVLARLEEEGFVGIPDLIRNTMKIFRNSSQASQASQGR
ncbi:hypothetical protein jhhlp_008707 [Lomentospora prolificans]|uniref:Mis6 domain protein n=1 Tax=Lomentospora prolificans TaxID=41688 RepID=A0A2N3MYS9_9PEZI|nr:hypothetical protein jhhlp_008707 [Lomentospora prolificans]